MTNKGPLIGQNPIVKASINALLQWDGKPSNPPSKVQSKLQSAANSDTSSFMEEKDSEDERPPPEQNFLNPVDLTGKTKFNPIKEDTKQKEKDSDFGSSDTSSQNNNNLLKQQLNN